MPSEDCEKGGTSAAPQRSAIAGVNAPALSIADAKNVGADVTLSQQARILCSASLAAFTVVGMYAFLGSVDHPGFWVFVLIRTGLTQAFGVFQEKPCFDICYRILGQRRHCRCVCRPLLPASAAAWDARQNTVFDRDSVYGSRLRNGDTQSQRESEKSLDSIMAC
jgi:hypothetical protein